MCLYRLWLIAFDEASSWILDNEFARTFVIFGDDKSLLYYANNSKKSFLVLGEGPTNDDINDNVGATEKMFIINFSKTKTTFFLSF